MPTPSNQRCCKHVVQTKKILAAILYAGGSAIWDDKERQLHLRLWRKRRRRRARATHLHQSTVNFTSPCLCSCCYHCRNVSSAKAADGNVFTNKRKPHSSADDDDEWMRRGSWASSQEEAQKDMFCWWMCRSSRQRWIMHPAAEIIVTEYYWSRWLTASWLHPRSVLRLAKSWRGCSTAWW